MTPKSKTPNPLRRLRNRQTREAWQTLAGGQPTGSAAVQNRSGSERMVRSNLEIKRLGAFNIECWHPLAVQDSNSLTSRTGIGCLSYQS